MIELEEHLESELQLPHVDTRTCAGDSAEVAAGHYETIRINGAAGQEIAWVAKIRMVGAVETFKPELPSRTIRLRQQTSRLN